jgi:hypothetical protein
MRRPLVAAAVAVALLLGVQEPADASYLLTRDATVLSLKVNAKGVALVTYRANGRIRRVRAWGAINARHPSQTVPQVQFRLDYSGRNTSGFRDASLPYDGPVLPWFVLARKAPDGSYWALQRWARLRPGYGQQPRSSVMRAWELRLSHWTGETAKLELWTDWVDQNRVHHLFGRLTYRGVPVFGFGNSSTGNPHDAYGRNVYLDTFNSAYGRGWKRENGFLTHRPNGNFCYGFYRHEGYGGVLRPRGNGDRYRATVIGPGVTPDVFWEGAGLPRFNPLDTNHVLHDQRMAAMADLLIRGDPDDPCTRR